MSVLTADFKSRDGAITQSHETLRTSNYAPGGLQGIALAGLVPTRPATILAPSLSFILRT